MVFGRAVKGSVLGYSTDELVYPALRVIPMVWVLAVFLFQHIHRRLALQRKQASPAALNGAAMRLVLFMGWRRAHGRMSLLLGDRYTWMTLTLPSSCVTR